MNTFGRGYRTANALAAGDSTTWTLLDWMFARYTLTPEEARGKPVRLVGFVYRAPASRLANSTSPAMCSPAASPTVRASRCWCAGPVLRRCTTIEWVRVTGSIEVRPGADQPEFMIANAQVAQVEPPKEPYLYPITA